MNPCSATWFAEIPSFLPSSLVVRDPLGIIFGLGWVVYIAIYWICLMRILRATRFEAADKILWFLVITMAPVIGILAFWWNCPAFVLNRAPHDKPDD
jgi:hypothetical protein